MKTIIIYKSIHLGSTKKIAQKIGEVLGADVFDVQNMNTDDFSDYDLIGIGSGIYDGGFHKALVQLVKYQLRFSGKKVFLFSTAGIVYDKSHQEIKQKLMDVKADIVGEFYCKGFNKNSFLKYTGGMNKGRPNAADIEKAIMFATNLKNGHPCIIKA